jgi:hypothetical protein
MDQVIPILSLVVAALAVFVGPLVSWFVAKRQVGSSLALTDKQIRASLTAANTQTTINLMQLNSSGG